MLRNTLAAALMALAIQHPSAAIADALPGYDRLTIKAPHRAGLVEGSVWYPVGSKTYQSLIGKNPAFQGVPAFVGAGLKEGGYPLVVLSHGSGGNMDNLGWLATALVEQGAMVLAVNHPGSTSGDSSPRRSIQHWNRPMDLTAALDTFLADPLFGGAVDQNRISMLGFSLGGLTALQMAGLQPDLGKYLDYCARYEEGAVDCTFFEKGGVDLSSLPADSFEQPLKDARITQTVAVDPALGHAFSDASIAAVDQPIQLVSLGTAETIWPAVNIGPGGSNLAARIPGAEHVEIANADHFSFLGLCTEIAPMLLKEEGEDPICDDPAGVDRDTLHKQIAADIIRFLGL